MIKMVLNKCYGGFGLSAEAREVLDVDWPGDLDRTDARLVEMVEDDPEAVAGSFAKLQVVSLPDETTDYHIDEYDGFETVTYVVDGKLHWA
jgi:redox-sensitive bicupin YhaK (pirin superfamily)